MLLHLVSRQEDVDDDVHDLTEEDDGQGPRKDVGHQGISRSRRRRLTFDFVPGYSDAW